MGRMLVFTNTDNGCIVPSSHKLNQDGYFRKNFGDRYEMYHRYVWSLYYGEIPEGYEVNHKCRNRACCNVEHLEILPEPDHTALTNRTRYLARKLRAKKFWEDTGCNGTDLGKEFGVTFSAACKWIREWKV